MAYKVKRLRLTRDVPRTYPAHKEIDRILHAIIDVCWAESWNVPEIARRANVSRTTVYAILDRKAFYPRFNTIVKLCRACGLELMVSSLHQHRKVG